MISLVDSPNCTFALAHTAPTSCLSGFIWPTSIFSSSQGTALAPSRSLFPTDHRPTQIPWPRSLSSISKVVSTYQAIHFTLKSFIIVYESSMILRYKPIWSLSSPIIAVVYHSRLFTSLPSLPRGTFLINNCHFVQNTYCTSAGAARITLQATRGFSNLYYFRTHLSSLHLFTSTASHATQSLGLLRRRKLLRPVWWHDRELLLYAEWPVECQIACRLAAAAVLRQVSPCLRRQLHTKLCQIPCHIRLRLVGCFLHKLVIYYLEVQK